MENLLIDRICLEREENFKSACANYAFNWSSGNKQKQSFIFQSQMSFVHLPDLGVG
jgi:hypothetical protein